MSDPNEKIPLFSHARIETNSFLMIVLIVVVVSIAGLVEIVPLFCQCGARCQTVRTFAISWARYLSARRMLWLP